MKIRAETLLSTKKDIQYNKILVTGSDESFIGYVKNYFINRFKNKNYSIDLSGNYNSGLSGDLFTDKKTLFLLSDYSNKNEFDSLKTSESQCILIASSNKNKSNAIRASFTKMKDAVIVECYQLNRKSKELTLKHYIDNNQIELSANVFWYVVDKFDNNYVIFINQLDTLSLFKKKVDLVSDAEKITFSENKTELGKMFFSLFKNNNFLVDVFNKSITSISDFYIFLNSIKLYIYIISVSEDERSAIEKFPKYLFAEKIVFLRIYNKLNNEKLVKIYKNISKVEDLVRKNSNLYSVLGLRFFLNIKKIIIS